MAASLNPPSHFVSTSQAVHGIGKEGKRSDLKPPSTFQRLKSSDPLQSLAEATQQILELKLENQRLRDSTARHVVFPGGEQEIKARVDIHQAGRQTDLQQLHQTSDVITQQATQIAQLRVDWKNAAEKHTREMRDLQEMLAKNEFEYSRKIMELESQLKITEDSYQREVTQLRSCHERELLEKSERIATLTEQLEASKHSHQNEVTDLQDRLEKQHGDSRRTVESLQHQLRIKSDEIESLQSQMTQLKTYLGNSLPGTSASTAWKVEKQQLEKKINDTQKDNENMQSTIQLLNIRLSSVNEILSIQETELSKSKAEILDSGNKKTQSLLNKWREKVFGLLVQQKSQELVSKKDNQNYRTQIIKLEKELSSCRNECSVLQHSLRDKDAEIQMQSSKYKALQEEFSSVQEIASILDVKLQESEHVLDGMKSFVASVVERNGDMEKTLQAAFTNLASYEKRLDFACGRIQMLQGLLARKETVWKMQLEKALNQQAERDHVIEHDRTSSPGLESERLAIELERVTKERDKLALQIQQDNQMIQQHVFDAKQKYEKQSKDVVSTVEEQKSLLMEKSQRISELNERLVSAEDELQEARETIDMLKTNLAKEQVSTEQVAEEKCNAISAKYVEKLAEMEKRLNDVRREHTKAVVSMRQIERQLVRQKERHNEKIKSQEEMFQKQLDKLQRQLRESDKDRNLLMATLRQEGLIGKYKGARSVAMLPDDLNQQVDSGTESKTMVHDNADQVSVEAVVEDLQALTAAILDGSAD
ncbi:coiled-coil alpha-helical rod protein 1-like isoform X2 [Ptychodera flava]|uniref:coiled-coil alpha-helical rod protein 1-like isoform X2 n=1 Tax=Ptychodera flava TaxID=63121 RepID=UPI00396A9584